MPAWMGALFKEKNNYKMYNLNVKYFNSPKSKIIKSFHYILPNIITKDIKDFVKNGAFFFFYTRGMASANG